MRTTLDLPDDLHRIVLSLAVHTRSSLSHTAAQLMRRGLVMPAGEAAGAGAGAAFSLHPATGLPVLILSRAITPEDVKALDDDA